MTEPSAGRREEIIAQFSEYIVGEGRLPQNFYGRDAVIRMVDAALEAQPDSRDLLREALTNPSGKLLDLVAEHSGPVGCCNLSSDDVADILETFITEFDQALKETKMTEPNEAKQILINLMAGMVLADHMGDVASDCLYAAKQLGITVPDDFITTGGDAFGTDTPLERLSEYLTTYHDATTVYGTELSE